MLLLANLAFYKPEKHLKHLHMSTHLTVLSKSFPKWIPTTNTNMTWFNPLMLTAAKTSLTILKKSFRFKHNWQNIWRRNVDQNITNNSPSNILWNNSQFKSYCQKYNCSRRQYSKEGLSINGLNGFQKYFCPCALFSKIFLSLRFVLDRTIIKSI